MIHVLIAILARPFLVLEKKSTLIVGRSVFLFSFWGMGNLKPVNPTKIDHKCLKLELKTTIFSDSIKKIHAVVTV